VNGFSFYSASNISKLSITQVKSLRENQLISSAAIHDDRHLSVATTPAVTPKVNDSVLLTQNEELIRKNILLSIENNPIAIRENWSALSDKITIAKQANGDRVISWKLVHDPASEWFSLISFKKTGENRYRQTVEMISKSAEFTISEDKWKLFKEMELLLVCSDIQNKSDRFSNFFHLKRRRAKTVENPFQHS
jgi:hypothetical protein